jgi:uncharacterized membrane protein YfcA
MVPRFRLERMILHKKVIDFPLSQRVHLMVYGQAVAMMMATFVGFSLGALGSGGSILTIPLLVYVAGVPAENAVGMSLLIVAAASLSGTVIHLRSGNVALKACVLFALTGMVGSYLGSYATHLVTKKTLMLLFAGTMMVVGIRMWRAPKLPERGSFNALRCLLIGFVVGLLTGFLGIGGGFLIVPSLVLFAGVDSRTAAATSLAVITLNSTTAIAGQLRFATFDWGLIAGFLIFTVAGVLAGAAVANRLADYRLRRLFAGTVLVLGIVIIAANLVS